MKKTKGFTLIELLIVVAIIGLISTLASVALNTARQKSRDVKRVADIRQIQVALEMYFQENQTYPEVLNWEGLGFGNFVCLDGTDWRAAGACTTPLFIGNVPADPMSPKILPIQASNPFEYRYSQLDTWDDDCYIIQIYLEVSAGDLGGDLFWYFDPNSYASDPSGGTIPGELCT